MLLFIVLFKDRKLDQTAKMEFFGMTQATNEEIEIHQD